MRRGAGARERLDLCRLFARSAEIDRVRPLLLADDRPASVTHAYAAMKLMTQRAGLVVHDLLLGAAKHSPRSERIAMQIATCADDFLGAVLRDWVQIDPACDATEAPTPELRRLVREQLRSAHSDALPDLMSPQLMTHAGAVRAWPTTEYSGAPDVHRQRPAGPELDLEAVQLAGAPPRAPDDREAARQRRDRRPDPGRHDRPRRCDDPFRRRQGVQFETFATQRIRGAMLDELRGNDYLSRGTRKQQRTIESAVHKLEQKLGRAPVESEIAREMGVTLVEYQELLGKVRGTQLVYLEDMAGDEGDTISSTATWATKRATRSRSCRITACARRSSRRSRCCPNASST